MFCYQCQETARGTGCTKVGVCGKRPELSGMLDLLVYVTKGLSCVTTMLREEGKEVGKDVNHLVTVNLFATITNANFDRDAIIARIKETLAVKEELRAKLVDPTGLPEAAVWNGNENEFDSKHHRRFCARAGIRAGGQGGRCSEVRSDSKVRCHGRL